MTTAVLRRPVRTAVRRTHIRILILGLLVGAGAMRLAERQPQRAPRVDSGQLGGFVWEMIDPNPSSPPTCHRLGRSDIGPWRCSIRYSGAFDPTWAPLKTKPIGRVPTAREEVAFVTVAADGRMRGHTAAGHPISGCCLHLR